MGLNISVKNPPNVHLFNEEYISQNLKLVDILDVFDFIDAYDAVDDLDVTDEFDDSVDNE